VRPYFSIAAMESTMTMPTAVAVVHEFWRRMATNDFTSLGDLCAPDFVLEWPQSGERIRGVERFARMNAEYPAHGRWHFTVLRVVGSEAEAVSDVQITDGVQAARAISFFTIKQGQIVKLVEFWPEPYPAPTNRAHLVEYMAE